MSRTIESETSKGVRFVRPGFRVTSARPQASGITTHDGYQAGMDDQAALRFQRSGDHWVLMRVTVSSYTQKLIMSKSEWIEPAKSKLPVQQTITASLVTPH